MGRRKEAEGWKMKGRKNRLQPFTSLKCKPSLLPIGLKNYLEGREIVGHLVCVFSMDLTQVPSLTACNSPKYHQLPLIIPGTIGPTTVPSGWMRIAGGSCVHLSSRWALTIPPKK